MYMVSTLYEMEKISEMKTERQERMSTERIPVGTQSYTIPTNTRFVWVAFRIQQEVRKNTKV